MSIESILEEKYGMKIPDTPKPGGIYSPVRRVGNLLYLSGQTPTVNGVLAYTGVVGRDLSIEDGQKASQLCALNLLAALKSYLEGDLSRVRKIVQLVGYVRSAENFGAQPQVINGASQIFADLYGQAGLASRLALGTSELPGGAPVEVMIVVEID